MMSDTERLCEEIRLLREEVRQLREAQQRSACPPIPMYPGLPTPYYLQPQWYEKLPQVTWAINVPQIAALGNASAL